MKIENKKSDNEIQELNENKKIMQIGNDLLCDKLEMLHGSIDAISNAKKLEEKYLRKIHEQEGIITSQKQDNLKYQLIIKTIQGQLDTHNKNLNDIIYAKTVMEMKKDRKIKMLQ